jgi:haloalkane dehalogenase
MNATYPVGAKKFIGALGKSMAYLETGTGLPILFLHGNPTSSYLWRNIMPYLQHQGRCLAPDLIGMGDSEKLDPSGPSAYRFVEHRRYLDAAIDALGIEDRVTLIVHDWGSVLGFDWACRNPDRVSAIAYMESFVRPLLWSEFPEPSRPLFKSLRSKVGEELILDKNIFVERILPASIQRRLTDIEMAEYRRPYLESGESRRPMLTWPRELPIDGEPADVVEIVHNYAQWMSKNEIPKLFINAAPGAVLTGPQRDYCRTWLNQTEVTVPGIHFIQEDAADEIGAALAAWRTPLF